MEWIILTFIKIKIDELRSPRTLRGLIFNDHSDYFLFPIKIKHWCLNLPSILGGGMLW